jgi:hypothetical protein
MCTPQAVCFWSRLRRSSEYFPHRTLTIDSDNREISTDEPSDAYDTQTFRSNSSSIRGTRG